MIVLVFAGMLLAFCASAGATQSHPFLICTEDGKDPNFASLQARATVPDSPWAKMKQKAKAGFDGIVFDEVRIYSSKLSVQDVNDIVAGSGTTENLELYWALNESTGSIANDGSSSPYHHGTVEDSEWVTGYNGNALRLWGSNDYIVADGYAGITGSNTPRSVCAWIKTSDCETRRLVDWGKSITNQNWAIALVKISDDSTILVAGGGVGGVFGTTHITDGQWHHIAVVSDGSNTDKIELYIDGNRETDATATSGTINTEASLDVHIGWYSDVVDTHDFGRIRKTLARATLHYILNESDRADCVDLIKSEIQFIKDIYDDGGIGITDSEDPLYYNSNVVASIALFGAVLALDIIYNDLDSTDSNSLEDFLNTAIPSIDDNSLVYYYSIRGIWDIYTGSTTTTNIDGYDDQLNGQRIGEDGVTRISLGYAWYVFSGTNENSAFFLDVLEFTGKKSYYDNPRLQNFFEWLYGYSLTPTRQFHTFGQTDARRTIIDGTRDVSASIFRAYRFSAEAAQYAAWCNAGKEPPGELLHYILMEQQLPAPLTATSRAFPEGGAFFREDSSSELALAGALWNQREGNGHGRHDMNAIQLCAYGEKVTQNRGYISFSQKGTSHSEGASTLLIDNNDHPKYDTNGGEGPTIGGIVESLITPQFDYACGDIGWAISGYPPKPRSQYHNHLRNFVFVHPSDGKNGYWLLFDEVDAYGTGHQANLVFHPDSADDPRDNPDYSENKQYTWDISQFQENKTTSITIFLGTAPDSVTVKESGDASYYGRIDSSLGVLEGTYIKANYNTDDDGLKNIVTVLFPHDDIHDPAEMTRITHNDYTGAKIDHGGSIVDYAIESDSGSESQYNDIYFNAKAVYSRRLGDNTISYFARHATLFMHDKDSSYNLTGFEVASGDSPISIYMRQGTGKLITTGLDTDIILYHPGVQGITVKDSDGTVIDDLDPAPSVSGSTVDLQLPDIAEYQIELATYTVGILGATPEPSYWYLTIQDAIDAASNGDEIVVYPGTYYENIDFLGKAITLRSEDPENWDVVSATIIDANDLDTVVTFDNGEDASSVLEGFTITGGLAPGTGNARDGGGIYCYGSSPTISKCIITGNYAGDDGGGIFCDSGSSPVITQCVIKNNVAADKGGGIYSRDSNPSITAGIIKENDAKMGAGMYMDRGQPSINSCFINDNETTGTGSDPDGGAIFLLGSTLTLSNSTIFNNYAGDDGGAICCKIDGAVRSDLTMSNCLLYDNVSGDKGGGIYCADTDSTIINCTFTANDAGTGGGLYNKSTADAEITNCLFWDNTATSTPEIYNAAPAIDFVVTFSNIEGGFTGTDNIDSDPLFVDAANDDYHLTASSPCINGGDNSVYSSGDVDIDGDERKMAEYVDIGADEFLDVYNTRLETRYSTIQGAIDDVNLQAGDTIEVGPGTYFENIDFDGMAITLTSSDPDDWDIVGATIIDGDASGSVVTFDDDEGPDSVITGFTITNGSYGYGAGIFAYNTSPTISNCIITNNAGTYGGGIYLCDYQGPVSNINNCIISENTASEGAGIYCGSSAIKIHNCLIYSNSATSNGGGIYSLDVDQIANCTIVDNDADTGGGIYNEADCTVANCIFWDNTATSNPEIYSDAQYFSVTYSNIEGGYGYTGNIDSDPLFVDAANDDYHLTANSPCINAGTNSEYTTGDTDIDGEDRKLGAKVDMGADESDAYPVALWKLDETSGSTAGDSSGNSYDGTVSGAIWDSGGKIDGALDLNGTDDYVEVSGYNGIGGNAARTVCAWIKTDEDTTVDTIVQWGEDASTELFLFYTYTYGGSRKLIFAAYGGAAYGSTTIADDTWQHVAVVIEEGLTDASQVKLYVDGNLENTTSLGSCAVNTSTNVPVNIGIWKQVNGTPTLAHPFNGLIDDVRIYERALSADEIALLAAMGN